MIDEYETRLSTAERLLTKEQVNALESIEDLEAIQEAVMDAAKAIEVDLEFRTDEGADEFWGHRARRALTAHYICNGHITRRLAFLRRGGKPPKDTSNDAKARKKEAHAQLLAEQAEAKRLKAQEDREKSFRAMLAMLERQSLLAHFKKVAAQHLPPATMGQLMNKARDSLERALVAEMPVRDSGRHPEGENAGTAVEGEACQSGDAEGSASPNPFLSGDSPNG